MEQGLEFAVSQAMDIIGDEGRGWDDEELGVFLSQYAQHSERKASAARRPAVSAEYSLIHCVFIRLAELETENRKKVKSRQRRQARDDAQKAANNLQMAMFGNLDEPSEEESSEAG